MARASSVPAWLLAVLRCPQDGCGGELRSRGAAGLGCRRCAMPFPVLGGVPVLVPEPHAYCASYRESIVAALAEDDVMTPAALAQIDAYASAARGAEPRRFGDDWSDGELALPQRAAAPPLAGLGRFLAAAEEFETTLAGLVADEARVVLDLGCGDGGVAARLVRRGRRVVVGDLSLRAVLRARAAARGAAAVVADAAAPPFRPGSLDAIACVNLIDLLEQPFALPDALAAALRPGGRLILSTPDPGLGADDPAVLDAAMRRAGLAIEAVHDPVPWAHVHSSREAQVFLCRVVVASRRNRVRSRRG